MLVFFINIRIMEFQVRYLVLVCPFSVIDGIGWFWMVIIYKNFQLMLEFLNALFFVQHFSCYTVITFLKILSVTLLSMLMILLCYLKCDQTSDLWQQLELASEQESDLLGIAEWVRKWLVHISAGNVSWNWFYLSSLITLVLLMWK